MEKRLENQVSVIFSGNCRHEFRRGQIAESYSASIATKRLIGLPEKSKRSK
jgi:hypothetical protein